MHLLICNERQLEMLRNDAFDKYGAHFRTVELMLWRDSLHVYNTLVTS
jgi:hypothetical protein